MKVSIEGQLRELVVDELGVTAEAVTLDAHLKHDLGADSLDALELTLRVEDEFGLEIPNSDADALETFGQLVAYVTARMDARP
jgi:acyl carrier protein